MVAQSIGPTLDRIGTGITRIADRVPQVLENPLGYAQEAFVLAAMVALVLIIALLVAVVVIESAPARSARRSLGYRRRPHVTVRKVSVVAGVIMVVGAALSLSPLVPAVGGACAGCHELGPAVESWRADVHAGVSCYACHARRGALGALQAGAEGLVRLTARPRPSSALAPVFEGGCLPCHDEIDEGVTTGALRMRHSDVIAAGYACLGCHPDTGHASMERPALPVTRSRMSVCLGCHDGVTAASACTTCHDGRPSDTTSAAAPGTTRAPVTCEGCHSEATERACVACHGLVLPHPPEFRGDHARLSWRDPGLCARCHEAAAPRNGCDCHGDVNVHGTYNEWFPRHGSAARDAWPGGCRCHQQSFCEMCHDRVP